MLSRYHTNHVIWRAETYLCLGWYWGSSLQQLVHAVIVATASRAVERSESILRQSKERQWREKDEAMVRRASRIQLKQYPFCSVIGVIFCLLSHSGQTLHGLCNIQCTLWWGFMFDLNIHCDQNTTQYPIYPVILTLYVMIHRRQTLRELNNI